MLQERLRGRLWTKGWFPSLELPTRSPRSEVRLRSSPGGSSDSTSFPLNLNLDLVLFFFDPEELGHSILLVSCALRVEHEAHCAVFQPRLRTAIGSWRGNVSQSSIAGTRDWSKRFLGFRFDGAVRCFGAIGDGSLALALEMAWVLIG